MQINALIERGLKVFPCWTRYDSTKNKWLKGPRIEKGSNWQTVDPTDPRLDWSGGTYGVVVPPGVVIFDLDTHKGVTREAVENFLGVRIDWDRAHIQTTISGGAHYALRVNYPVRQSVDWIPGFDTRTSGVGFICSGEGYTPAKGLGVGLLAFPESLPELPAGLPIAEERRETPRLDLPDPAGRDSETLIEALHYVSPEKRTDWLTVGMGIKNYYHDDPEAGFAIFDKWARGEYSTDGMPDGYAEETQWPQWQSWKVENGDKTVRIGTVFHMAAIKGWVPPRSFDIAAAFGAGGVSADEYNRLVDEIEELGSNPKDAESLLSRIQTMNASGLQRALLAAILKRQMKEAGLLTKALSEAIDLMIGISGDAGVDGIYGKNHTANALLFLERCYPDGTLVKVDGNFYAYDGKIWIELNDSYIKHQIAVELSPIRPQANVIAGTYQMVDMFVHRVDLSLGDVPPDYIVMQNGILDLNTLQLNVHDKRLFTTNILPYSFDPYANCPTWHHFLNQITEGDDERIALLQEWFGYMLANDYRFQKIMLILGPQRCGKGTIGRILNCLTGDSNFTGAGIADLLENKFLETLPTKTVMFDGDVQKTFKGGSAEGVTKKLKNISGNDRVTIPRLYNKPLNMYLPTRFTLAANHVPRLFDDSGALAGRIMILPLYVSFYGREDLDLFAKLSAEIEGIAVWALNGLMRLRHAGRFTAPAASIKESEQLSEQYSPIKQYVDSNLTLAGPNDYTSVSDVYESYRAWALNEGEEQILSRRLFVSSFKDLTRGRGVDYTVRKVDGESVRSFKGVAITGGQGGTAGAFN